MDKLRGILALLLLCSASYAQRPVVKGSIDQSVVIRIVDAVLGTPETAVDSTTQGLDLEYWRVGDVSTDISDSGLSDLANHSAGHSDGGILHIGNGYYRVDVEDDAFATGADEVLVHGTADDMVVIGVTIPLVAFDVQSAAPEVTLTDGAHGGSAATLDLKGFTVIATDNGANAVTFTGKTTGAGLKLIGGTSGDGLYAEGHATGGNGIEAVGDSSAGGGMYLSGAIGLYANAVSGSAMILNGSAGQPDIEADEINAILADTADMQPKFGTILDLGTGATLATNLADIEAQTDDIGAAGAGLTAVPWNAAWDAEVLSEATDALVAQGYTSTLATDLGTTNSRVATALPNAAPQSEGGLLTFGDGDGQIDAANGAAPADVVAIDGDSTAADNAELFFDGTGYAGGTTPLKVRLADTDHGGANSTLELKGLTVTATDANANAVTLTGNGTGAGLKTQGGALAPGLYARGGATIGEGILASGPVSEGFKVTTLGTTASAMQISSNSTVSTLNVTNLGAGGEINADELVAILADTDELQTDWTDGGRLDLLLDGISGRVLTALPNAVPDDSAGLPTVDKLIEELDEAIITGSLTIQEFVEQSAPLFIAQGIATSYAAGRIWVDTNDGVAGETEFLNGTVSSPVLTIEDAFDIAENLGDSIKDFNIANGSAITLSEPSADKSFTGNDWTLALGSQDISGSHFSGAASITGEGTGTLPVFDRCTFDDVELPPTTIVDSSFGGDFTASDPGHYLFVNGASAEASGGDPQFDFSGVGGVTQVDFRNWTGGIEIVVAQDVTVTFDAVSAGVVTLTGNGGSGATVHIRGNVESVVDNTTGTVTVNQDGRD